MITQINVQKKRKRTVAGKRSKNDEKRHQRYLQKLRNIYHLKTPHLVAKWYGYEDTHTNIHTVYFYFHGPKL